MWLLYRSIVPVEQIMARIISHNNNSCSNIVAYYIEDIKKIDGSDRIQLLIRSQTTNEILLKDPFDLYQDRNFLISFSSQDIQTIIFHAFYQQERVTPNLIAFEGFDYSSNHEIAIFSNNLTKQQLTKNLAQLGKNDPLIELLQSKDAFYLGILTANRCYK